MAEKPGFLFNSFKFPESGPLLTYAGSGPGFLLVFPWYESGLRRVSFGFYFGTPKADPKETRRIPEENQDLSLRKPGANLENVGIKCSSEAECGESRGVEFL